MKIRTFKQLKDGVFHVRIQTEDWSEHDYELMVKFGEPEINLGGTYYVILRGDSSSSGGDSRVESSMDDIYARIKTESPFTRKFDSRDYNNDVNTAKIFADGWATYIVEQIWDKVQGLRDRDMFLATEEIVEL